tara:strand:+ start:463 stop:606 length:144 start_codon:yes stop_codon:yes gene_type:complete
LNERLVYTGVINNQDIYEIDISNFDSGVYFLTLRKEKELIINKIIKE